ncbi:unnamed protein product [Musa hybrid cultivar]
MAGRVVATFSSSFLVSLACALVLLSLAPAGGSVKLVQAQEQVTFRLILATVYYLLYVSPGDCSSFLCAFAEDLVRGETLVGQSNSHRQLGLRLLSGGLQRAAAERRLLRPGYPHLPCFHRHEPLLPGDGQEQVELLLRQLGARRDDRPE